MGLIDRFIKTEKRSLENPNIPVSADDFLHIMGWGNYSSAAGITVNTNNALGVPAVWAAVKISYRERLHLFHWRFIAKLTQATTNAQLC